MQTTYKQIWRVAYPIILGNVAYTLINVIDTIYLGRLNEIALGAAGIAGIFYLVLSFICVGMGVGLQIMIARRMGEGKISEAGKVFNMGAIILLFISLLLFLFLFTCSEPILKRLVSSDEVYLASIEYLKYLSPAIIFVGLDVLLKSFYTGISRTKIITINAIIMALINIIGDYVLIFGHWGFPAMGIAGAAIASLVAEGVASITILIYTLVAVNNSELKLFHFRKIEFHLFKRLMNLSMPVVAFYLFAFIGWFIFFIIIEKLGSRPLAVSNIVRSLSIIFSAVGVGFAVASNTLVSRAIGQGQKEQVKKLIRKIIHMSFLITLGISMLGFVFPEYCLSIYTNNPELIQESVHTFWVMLLGCLIFSVSTVFFNSLTGTGDTKAALVFEGVAVISYVFLAYCMVCFWDVKNVAIVWFMEVYYWLVLGVFCFLWLKSNRWSRVQV